MTKHTNTVLKRPSWLKVKAPADQKYFDINDMMKELNLATVCQEARCPNIGECWESGTATFMLMGEVCTRACKFCSVKTGNPKGLIDVNEPYKVGYAISKLDLDYVVLTSVNRDDLEDEGADHFAKTVEVIKSERPDMLVEILTPDFHARGELIDRLIEAKPDVFAHNLETVRELTKKVRDRRATYDQSLRVLQMVKEKDSTRITKTSLMLGLGEKDEQVLRALRDLREVNCDVVTFGQYMQPTKRHLPIEEFISPDKFNYWKQVADEMGFLYVASGPLVRSSYKAGEFYIKGMIEARRK